MHFDRCRTPERHVDKLLSEIPNYELRCEYASSVYYPALWTSISILLVALVLIATFFLLRRPFARWDITRRNRDTVTYTNVVESSNDLVRILAVGETLDRNEE